MPVRDTIQGSSRRSTTYEVIYSTLPSLTDTLPKPESIVIHQKQYFHDVAVLSFPVLNYAAMTNLKTGVPILIKWKKGARLTNWIGYVSHVSSETSATPRKRVEVHCIGASFPLKMRKSRTFKNKTIPQVARIIAKEHGFKFIGEPNPRVFPQLTISGQSHWEWLQEQGKRIGYALRIEGMTMVFRPIDRLIDHASTDVPILSYFANDFPTDVIYEDRTLDYFKVLNGEYIEGTELRNAKVVGGVNPITGKTVKSTKSPKTVGTNVRSKTNDVFFTEHRTSQVAHDYASATIAAEGAAHMARFTTPATVKCQGDARIRPYSPVYIDGISDHLDGYWVVTSAKHFLTIGGEYQIEMTVASDGTGKNVGTALRQSEKNLVGTVNITAAIENREVTQSYSVIHTKKPILVEKNQGFKRTPTIWKSQPRMPRKNIK